MQLKICLLSGLLALTACQPGSETSNDTPSVAVQYTEWGSYPYYHHIKKGGVTPKQKQVAQFHIRARSFQGKVLDNNFGKEATSVTMPLDSIAQIAPSPIFEGLRRMSVGDSLTIHTAHDSLATVFDLVLDNIIDLEEIQKKFKAQVADSLQRKN